jgi:hypothetical protein
MEVIHFSSMTEIQLRLSQILYRQEIRTREKGQNYIGFGINIYVLYHMLIDQMISENLSFKFDLNYSESSSWDSGQRSAFEVIDKSLGYKNDSNSKINSYASLVGLSIPSDVSKIAHDFVSIRNVFYHSSVHRHNIGHFPKAAHDILDNFRISRFVEGVPLSWVDRMNQPDVIDAISQFIEYPLFDSMKTDIPHSSGNNLCRFSNIRSEAMTSIANIRKMVEKGVLGPDVYSDNLLEMFGEFPTKSNLCNAIGRNYR